MGVEDLSGYSLTWMHQNKKDSMSAKMHSVGPYTYAKMLEGQGCTEIKIYLNGEYVDYYVQGRSTRNLSSIPTANKQLELF